MRTRNVHKASAILGLLLTAAATATPIQVQASPAVACFLACGGATSLIDRLIGMFTMPSDPYPVDAS